MSTPLELICGSITGLAIVIALRLRTGRKNRVSDLVTSDSSVVVAIVASRI